MNGFMASSHLSSILISLHLLFNSVRQAYYWLCTDGPLFNGVCCTITVYNCLTDYMYVHVVGW